MEGICQAKSGVTFRKTVIDKCLAKSANSTLRTRNHSNWHDALLRVSLRWRTVIVMPHPLSGRTSTVCCLQPLTQSNYPARMQTAFPNPTARPVTPSTIRATYHIRRARTVNWNQVWRFPAILYNDLLRWYLDNVIAVFQTLTVLGLGSALPLCPVV
jgi:hypothetical protein